MSEKIVSEKIILGKNTCFEADSKEGINSHVCVFGGSGTGKTHSVVRPNMLEGIRAGASMIIADPKGALEKEFSNLFKMEGYRRYSIDLINPQKSASSFNPLDYLCSENDIIKLAHRIIYADPMTKACTKQDPYWLRQAEILLSMLIEMVIIIEDEAEETFDRVIYYASHLTADGKGETNDLMDKIAYKKPDCLATKQWKKIKNLMPAEKTFSCVVSSVQEHLGVYESEEMTAFFHKSKRIYFEDFAKKKSVLFLKVSDTDSTYYNWANIIYGQAIDTLSGYADSCADGRCPIAVRFFLDDFGTNSFVEGMPRIISTARARNISFMLVCQSVQQLRMGYKEDAQTIISNCDNIAFLGTNDVDTAKEFSVRLDLPVKEILSQKRGGIYIFRAGEMPIEDERYDYREHQMYKFLHKSKKEVKEI